MEQLFLTAQQRAIASAEQWCSHQLATFAQAGSFSVQSFPALLAALIDDWCTAKRRLAFAWRECQLMAVRDPRYLAPFREWRELWIWFWEEVCARCDLAGHGEMTSYMFDGESLLHLMQWRRVVDRACLDEVCKGWGLWLSGNLAPDGDWRLFARSEAAREMPEMTLKGEIMEQIAQAAAETLGERGMVGLTHRAVAGRAGLTLGVVSYNFPSSTELVRAAFEMIYRQAAGDGRRESLGRNSDSGADIAARDKAMALLPALDELLLAVARNPEFVGFVPQLRYWRGRTSKVRLQQMVGPERPISHLDAALFSGLVNGHRKAVISLPPEETDAQFAALTQRLRDLLIT